MLARAGAPHHAVETITDCVKRLIADFPSSFGDTIPAFIYMGEVNWYLAPPETPMPWKLMNAEGKQLFEDACVGGLTAEEMRADSERLFESAMGNAKLRSHTAGSPLPACCPRRGFHYRAARRPAARPLRPSIYPRLLLHLRAVSVCLRVFSAWLRVLTPGYILHGAPQSTPISPLGSPPIARAML